MASNLKPTFGYVVCYVKDVEKSVDFYAKAFGYNVRRLDGSHRWGELESGYTTIAFTPIHQHETDDLTGMVHVPKSDHERSPMELCLVFPDVDAAFKNGDGTIILGLRNISGTEEIYYRISIKRSTALNSITGLNLIRGIDVNSGVDFLTLFYKRGILLKYFSILGGKRAVEHGAVPVSQPEDRQDWPQKVGYVRDIDGMTVRMGSYVRPRNQE